MKFRAGLGVRLQRIALCLKDSVSSGYLQCFVPSSVIKRGNGKTHERMEVLLGNSSNVGKPIMNHPIFSLYYPFIVILGMVYYCFNYIVNDGFSIANMF